MMKNFCLLLLFSILSFTHATAQSLHAIIFANTECPGDPRNPNDQGIGESVSGDYYRMKIEMSTIASFIGYELKTYYYVGNQQNFSRKSLDKVIDGLRCGSDDIVFFYYSGHGARSTSEKTQFPQMNLIVDPYHSNNIPESQANYPLFNVKERIEAKNPRLTIVIGDLCNSVANWVTPKSLPSDKAATKVEEAPVQFYKDLFLKYKGSIIAASSKPGQPSEAHKDGGVFTIGLMQTLQIMVSNGMKASWNNLLAESVNKTKELSHSGQTPIFDLSNLRNLDAQVVQNHQSGTSQVQNTNQPVTLQNISASITSDEVALSALLTQIGSEDTGDEQRIQLSAETLKLIFASPNSAVEVVGRDGKTIVSTKNARDYLNWLTVTTHLYKVVPIRGRINDAEQLTYLRLHEMYK